MQVTEASKDGLKRELRVVVGADELMEKFSHKLNDMKGRVQLKGFRKGKVPVAHLKKVYGKALMAEVLDTTIKESTTKAIEERKERPAQQPDIVLPEDEGEVQAVIDGKADLAYSISFEVLPDIELTDFAKIELEKFKVEVEDAAIDEALKQIAERNQAYTAEEGRAAEEGDRVTIDFLGKIDGEPFDGGKGDDAPIVIGQGQFIPGFEEGLKGAKAGEDRVLEVTFPEEYGAEHLAGKAAQFDVKVKEVAKPETPVIDDAFAEGIGAENLEKLRALLSEQISKEYEQAARAKIKRELLDKLEEAHKFELPPSLVEQEFESVWKQLEDGLKQQGKTIADEDKSEDDLRAEYRDIAERRVRLGLVIGEIGDKNNIQVGKEELQRALIEQTRRYPGQEKMVYEYYEKTPGALAELRAPIFEDKVVDFILELAKPAEKTVTKDELTAAIEALEAEVQGKA